MAIEKILNKRSNAVVTEEGVETPKKPTSSQLDDGEIAVNYHKGTERIFIKNDNEEVVDFISKDEVKEVVDTKINEELQINDILDADVLVETGEEYNAWKSPSGAIEETSGEGTGVIFDLSNNPVTIGGLTFKHSFRKKRTEITFNFDGKVKIWTRIYTSYEGASGYYQLGDNVYHLSSDLYNNYIQVKAGDKFITQNVSGTFYKYYELFKVDFICDFKESVLGNLTTLNNFDKTVYTKTQVDELIPTSLSELTEDSEHRTITDKEQIDYNYASEQFKDYTVVNYKTSIGDWKNTSITIPHDGELIFENYTIRNNASIGTSTTKAVLTRNDETIILFEKSISPLKVETLNEVFEVLEGDVINFTNGLTTYTFGSDNVVYLKYFDYRVLPTKTSDLTNDSGFVSTSANNLVNYYLKSETYTKTEVQQLIGAIQQFHYEVYPTLPQTGASNVLYLIGPTGTGADKYEEYVYANNDWAKIGDTSIDLSGYVTTEALTTALADYVTSSALSTALAGKEDTTNKKTTIAGNEGDDTYYPSTKAVADYINEAKKQMLRELYLSVDIRPDSNVNRLRYNDTGADIIRTAEWGERVIHKAGHYWLNGLGDITEDEMSKIYSNGGILNPRPGDTIGSYLSGDYPFRTNLNIAKLNWNDVLQYQYTAMYNRVIRVINLGNNNPQHIKGFRQFGGSACKAIIPALHIGALNGTGSGNNTFYGVYPNAVMYVMLTNLVIDCPMFKNTPLIMYKCLKYLVDNAANTSAITITVHATTYGYLTDSSALPAEHSGIVETPADIATVTDEELVGMKEWDETTKKYVYATKAEWQQIITDATAKNISFASA